MPKLIVLSNRVNLPNSTTSSGGLAVALQAALSKYGGVWMGWNGEIIESSSDATTTNLKQIDNQFDTQIADNVTYITTPLTRLQYEKYYLGYANNRLWAAMHDRTDLIVASSEDFEVYEAVNQMFARQLQQIAEPDDIIWVQDYHFFGVAAHCRALGMKQLIGFFLHIPFPAADIWDKLTYGKVLMQQLLQYDVIGLQTQADTERCIDVLSYYVPNLKRTTSIEGKNLLQLQNHITTVKCYPIGVNPAQIATLAQLPLSKSLIALTNSAYKTIIAVERLDYSKGIPERLSAFAAFLRRYPQYIKKIQLFQIACPSRQDIKAYRDLRERVHQLVEKINQEFATVDWQPIIYQETPIAHSALMPLYRYCEICWVNSLKDGMNLVAKEYIAAQDPSHAGVLILSQNTGAAKQMTEAILVDPKDEASLVMALYTAITMTAQERQRRYQDLISGLYLADIDTWRDDFLNDLKPSFLSNLSFYQGS